METDKKPMLSIDADGTVLKCAKGASVDECGYKGGAVCGKCGATPVEMKMVPVSDFEEKSASKKEMMQQEEEMEEEEMEEEAPEDEEEDDEPEILEEEPNRFEDDEEEESSMKSRKKGMKKPYRKMMGADPEDLMDEDMVDAAKKGMGSMPMADEDMEDEEMEDEEDSVEKTSMMRNLRKRRIESMGMKAEDLGEYGYVCAIERKAHPGLSAVCDNCPGGCLSEKGLPGLLEVEGLAEKEFNGIVIDSGYAADADMFVVDIQVKDGSVREVYIDGTTAEVVGFHKLDDSVLEKKSAIDEMMVIGFVEAAELAMKTIEGTIVAVEPDIFEGIDSYAVEIDGIDGKSYDVFVGLDGEVLGYDKYEPEEAEDIEAEAAEIALKRAFSEERRMGMAKEGTAMSDGSYPIESEEDLRNAIQAYGRAKDKEAAKRHIMKRAKDLGKESLIPSNWVMGGDMKKKSDDEFDADFMKSLIEFELLQSDTENN
ncbi:hypothetical protein UFOVP658_119 [uncultured Caudovirales phage]|uniref:Uncharacterized protein n=1 Tax=uncultured Caudovirales phage TaxID=2100421 RepID=A0A6J5NAF1_9CAUD|nr:hypothetical protein UFOVP658_119 [uncultured Caudovirales phage]